MMRKLLLFLIGCFSTFILSAQDFSNKGKDFWLGYGYHVNMGAGVSGNNVNAQDMVLYFTANQTANVTVEIPAVGYTQNYLVLANQVTVTAPMPKTGTQDCRINDTGYFNRGIHITSTTPIVAYAHIYNSSVSGASLLFPTATLGQQYYSVSYTQASNASYANNFFFVVATEDNTTVEITPSAANKNNKPVGVPFTVNLNKGQIYSVFGTTNGNTGTDLTGSKIQSVNSGSGGCKRIAVFSGAGKMSIGVSTAGGSGTPSGSADNLFAQNFPSSAWGRRYLTSPTGSQPNNFYRVCVSDPTTVVKLNGNIIPASSLINNFYYQFRNSSFSTTTSTAAPNLIESDKPILVAQYCTTQGFEGNPNTNPGGDPEMIYLSPVEQTINDITLYSASKYQILQSYINVIIRNGGIASFKLDGVSMASSFQAHPRDPNYSYATLSVASGAHTLYSDTGFNAIAYGFGQAESYGYNAGTNVIDLYQYVTLQNPYAAVNFPATCVGTPFKFSITLPYQPTKLLWDFSQNSNLIPHDSVVVYPPTGQTLIPADSSFVKDGKNLYVYKIATPYTFINPGTFPIKVYANNPSADGCSGLQEINYDITVYAKPIADFTITHTGCVTDSVKFFDATNGNNRAVIKWQWSFGDATIDSVKNPVHIYSTPGSGTYNVQLTSYTDIGCRADTIKPIYISAVPVAKFGVSDTTCVGKTILYTDSSTIGVGSIVKWYWDYGNGIKDTLTANAPRMITYTTSGTYTVKLVVESNTGCKSAVQPKAVIVHDNPVPDFNLPIVCLPVGAAQFNNQTTIPDGTLSSVLYNWTFGDGGTSSQTNPSHNYSTTGPFNVNLKAISIYGCIKDTSKTLNTVYAAPIASFTVSAEKCLRDSTAFSSTGNPGIGNTIAKWYWNRDVATNTNNYTDTLSTFNYKYPVAKNYTIKMYFITDKGCKSDTATQTTIVHPLPLASFVNSSLLCEKNAVSFTTQSTPSVGTINRWYWNMGNGNTYNKTNNSTFNETYTNWAPYTITHMVETDKGCKSDTFSKTLNIRPLPNVGFVLPEVCLADAAAVFTDTSSIADGTQAGFTYNWSFNVSGIIPGPTPATSTIKNGATKFNKAANYQVKLKITSLYGCTDSLTQAVTVNGSIPKANFTVLNSNNLCSNLPVQIQNTSTVDFGWLTKLEIYWDFVGQPTVKFTDNNPQPNQIYSFKYADFQQPASKVYSIRLVAYSGGICADAKTDIITLNASPKVLFVTMPSICLDASPRQITQASETGGVAGASPAFMYYGTGVSSTGVFNPVLSGVGVFPIKYVYTSNKGCQDSASQSIQVWPSPTAVFGVIAPICEKNNVVFSDTSLANANKLFKWDWDFGDGTTATYYNGNPFIKVYNAGGSYNVTLKVTTDSGCVSPILPKTIKVNYLPQVSFTMPNICLPDGRGQFSSTSTIQDNSQALFSYYWDFGDPNDPTPSTLQSPTHKYTALPPNGGYIVKLKVTSKDGCIDSTKQNFSNVFPQPKASFVTTPSNGEVCLGDTIYFQDKSDGKTSAVNQWNWTFGDGSTSALQNPFRVYTDSGSFTAKLFVFNAQGCVSDTTSDKITIHPYPVLKPMKDVVLLAGGVVQLKPDWYATNPSFLWTPNADIDTATIPYPKVYPPNDRRYILQLTGIGGCSDTAGVFVKVLFAPVIPNAFSPNGDGINDDWKIDYLESYPGATVEVFDRNGKAIYYSKGYSKRWDGTINGQPLPIGTYYYIVDPKNGRAKMSGFVTILR